MKKSNKRQLNNAGFSLLEVLVTILIIAAVSVPLIRTFVVSSQVNHKARRLQNATDVAQNVAEMYRTADLSTLTPSFANANDSIIVYKDLQYTGADGEDFYVTVVMDSAGYTEYKTPELQNLFGEGGVNIYSEFTRYDARALNFLSEKVTQKHPAVSSISALDVKKKSTVTIDVADNFAYKYSIKVRYTYRNDSSIYYETQDMIIEEGNASTKQLPNVYLMYKPFDIYIDSTPDDVVEINYNYHGVNINNTDVNVYMIPQEVNCVDAGGNQTANLFVNFDCNYNNSNVNIKYNGANFDPTNDNTRMRYLYNLADDLTGAVTNTVVFYSVKVYVRYDTADRNDKDAYFNRKFDVSDVLTTVTDVRKE